MAITVTEPGTASSYPRTTTPAEDAPTELSYIKPELRDRLAPLASKDLLAAGVRDVLEEGGFGLTPARSHCGCKSCAQRCAVCEQRYHAQG